MARPGSRSSPLGAFCQTVIHVRDIFAEVMVIVDFCLTTRIQFALS